MAEEKTNPIKAEDKIEAEVAKTAYHFSGEMKYVPLSVEADSLEEAQKIWEKKRQLIN